MTLLDCNCPIPTAITTVPYNPCKDIFGKDGRWILQRLDDAGNAFVDAVNGIEEESSWTDLPDATDDTKVVITPLLEEVTFAEPAILEDSENLDGAPNVIGSGPQTVTAIVRNPTPAQLTALKSLGCESNLTFYRIDSSGRIMARTVSATPSYAGIKISPNTFIVRDPSRGGTRVDQPKAMIQFVLPAGWFDTTAVITPEAGFDPLTQILPS